MRTPIIMLSGLAGAGKDAVASILAKNHGAVLVAQSDPMKEFAREVFGFSAASLWGSSELRSKPVQVKTPEERDHAFTVLARGWIESVLPELDAEGVLDAHRQLRSWLQPYELASYLSPREVLQTLGTEWGRSFSEDMWVDYAIRMAEGVLPPRFALDTKGGGADLAVITDGRFKNELAAVRDAGGALVRVKSPGAGLKGATAQHSSETEQAGIPDGYFDAVIENDKTHGMEALEHAVFHLTEALKRGPYVISTRAA